MYSKLLFINRKKGNLQSADCGPKKQNNELKEAKTHVVFSVLSTSGP